MREGDPPDRDQLADLTAAEQTLVGRLTSAALVSEIIALRGAGPGECHGFKVELGTRTVADALLIAAKRNRP